MYQLSEQQIERILDDIRARGVEMEDLQLNLLDHVCCIIEQNLEANGDFETFYQNTIRTFYRKDLWEIEEETLTLLTFKNYYTMKKTMIWSGTATAFGMIFGIIFKFLHWPGASMLLVLGIATGSLLFLPLLFTLKAREKQFLKDKIALAAGALAAILISLSFLFKVMFWPGAVVMLYVSTFAMLLIFLPIHFFGGIRNPDTKFNTITTSILIIMAYGLVLLLVRSPRSSFLYDVKQTHEFVRNQKILAHEKQLAALRTLPDSSGLQASGSRIIRACEEARSYIIRLETGFDEIDEHFEEKNIVISDHYFPYNDEWEQRQVELMRLVAEYNAVVTNKKGPFAPIPVKTSIVDPTPAQSGSLNTFMLLNQLTQIPMFVLQNARDQVASR